jgi:hypothetical protein
MAVGNQGQVISLVSSGNLSAKQFYCVKYGTADLTAALQTSAGGTVVGVLQNTPSTGGGDGAAVMINGVTKAYQASTSNAAISPGDPLIASTAGAVLKRTTGNGTQFIVCRAMTALSSGTAGYVTVNVTLEGIASTSI